MPRHATPLRAGAAIALLAAIGLATPLAAQVPPSDTPRGPPLRAEPGDWWGDVHRWTGSDETRPRAGRPAAPPPQSAAAPPAAPRRASPAPEGSARTAITNANRRSNVRQEPSLNAPVVRSIAPNTLLNVYDEAPDGWYQVGEDAPVGWMHRSAMQRPPAAERP